MNFWIMCTLILIVDRAPISAPGLPDVTREAAPFAAVKNMCATSNTKSNFRNCETIIKFNNKKSMDHYYSHYLTVATVPENNENSAAHTHTNMQQEV